MLSGMGTVLMPTEEERKGYSLTQFSADFEKFYIEPGWVITAFTSLSLDEFDQAWELFVTTVRFNPWKFFVSNQKDYSEKKYRALMCLYCLEYDNFLNKALVDVKNKRLILLAGPERTRFLKKPGVVTVFQYWEAKRNTTYQHFYAFYFDRIVTELYETITTAYREHDTPDYPSLYKSAKESHSLLTRIFKRLRGGEYDGRYAYHLKRYKEVLDILQKERKLQEGGADTVVY
jgi:hypothetical protein